MQQLDKLNLIPNNFNRRMVKKTVDESTKEFQSKLLLFHQESIIVNVEYEKAVRMSNLTTTAINSFDALEHQIMKKESEKQCYTTERKRWVDAIEQVLLQNRALKAKRPLDRVVVSTSTKMTVLAMPPYSGPRHIAPTIVVSDGESDDEKCLSECSTAADDGNDDETLVKLKSKSFLDTSKTFLDSSRSFLDSSQSPSGFRDEEAPSPFSRADLFMKSGKAGRQDLLFTL